jgi:hypothetical protein
MAKKLRNGDADTNASNRAPTASSGMTRDEYMKRLSQNPRFRIVKPSGKGFVIGGVKPPRK